MVPPDLKRAVWRHYRVGQCDDKRPSREWHDAADAAIRAVAEKEAAAIGKKKSRGRTKEQARRQLEMLYNRALAESPSDDDLDVPIDSEEM